MLGCAVYAGPMIPMKSKTIFTSRWWALVWAAGILWAALDFISMAKGDDGAEQANSASNDVDANMSDDAQIAALSNTVKTLRAQ